MNQPTSEDVQQQLHRAPEQRVLDGDERALAEVFDGHRERLRRMVILRMDRRLRGRVDASDVLQDAYVDVVRQLPNYVNSPKLPLFLWIRRITEQRLGMLHRHHVGAAKRNASLDISIHQGAMPQVSSFVLAENLVGRFTSAGAKAIRAEMQLKLQEALNAMDDNDREIIGLRHFEQLSNQEIATQLGISEAAAVQRHYRAMIRLRDRLKLLPGMLE